MRDLKPASESRVSVCSVLAQPTARLRNAEAPTILNRVNTCFMAFLFSGLMEFGNRCRMIAPFPSWRHQVSLFSCWEIEHIACQPFIIQCLCPLIRRLSINAVDRISVRNFALTDFR